MMGLEDDTRKRYGFVLFIIVIVMLVGLLFFVQAVKDAMLENTETSLIDIATRSSVKIESDITMRLDTLASLANLKDIENPNIPLNERIKLIGHEAARGKFLRIGIADTTGQCATSDGFQFYIGDRDYFHRAMEGRANVSDCIIDRAGGNEIIVQSVPIYGKNKNVIGVLFATNAVEKLVSFVQNVYVGSEKNVLLLNKKGDILAGQADERKHSHNFLNYIAGSTDKKQYENIKNLIEQKAHGIGQYKVGDISYMVGVHSVENTDGWNMVVTVPKSSVMLPTNQILTMAILLVFILITCVIISIIYLYILNKKYVEEKANSQLKTERMRIKDAFIANVSHEIRTPMNAINGLMYFLKSTELSEEQKRHLKKIESATEILLGIINDILDISKISSGRMKLIRQSFAMAKVIGVLDDIFADRMKQKGLRWIIGREFEANVWIVGDRQRLLQIMINLVNNAYKFTEQGEIYLLVRQEEISEKTVRYFFSVQDTGIGIEEKNLLKLFTPFEQLENSTAKIYEGTGLGLSISDRLVGEMGGKIGVESQRGEGSKFHFSLEFERAAPEETQNEQTEQAELRVTLNQRVLLVEDNEINAEIAGTLLDEMGIAYDWAKNGRLAVELCQNRAAAYYQLILMDIHMPVMDGMQAAKIIRKELAVSAPIVALTAGVIEKEFLNDEKNCLDDFILKPFDIEFFKRKVVEHLNTIAVKS